MEVTVQTALEWWVNLGFNDTQKMITQGELCVKYFDKDKNIDKLTVEEILLIFKKERKKLKSILSSVSECAELNLMTDEEKVQTIYDIFDSLPINQRQRVYGYVSKLID